MGCAHVTSTMSSRFLNYYYITILSYDGGGDSSVSFVLSGSSMAMWYGGGGANTANELGCVPPTLPFNRGDGVLFTRSRLFCREVCSPLEIVSDITLLAGICRSLGRRHSETVHAARKNVAENAQKISTSRPVP